MQVWTQDSSLLNEDFYTKGHHMAPFAFLPAIVLLVGGIEVGLSYFPLFACLSTDFQVVGSALGFSYTFIW